MKGALAAVEIWLVEAGSLAPLEAPSGPGPEEVAALTADSPDPLRRRRLSLVIGTPERAETGVGWCCRVALADLHRPRSLAGRDSFEALVRAVEVARGWIAELHAEGHALYRDRAGEERFAFPERPFERG